MAENKLRDVIVVGGGPAGAITALELGRRGLRVLVLDRQVFPRKKVCADKITPRLRATWARIWPCVDLGMPAKLTELIAYALGDESLRTAMSAVSRDLLAYEGLDAVVDAVLGLTAQKRARSAMS